MPGAGDHATSCRARAGASGYLSMVGGIGIVIGPLLGGTTDRRLALDFWIICRSPRRCCSSPIAPCASCGDHRRSRFDSMSASVASAHRGLLMVLSSAASGAWTGWIAGDWPRRSSWAACSSVTRSARRSDRTAAISPGPVIPADLATIFLIFGSTLALAVSDDLLPSGAGMS